MIFLTVSRVLYDKGFGELAEASGIIKKRYSGVEFQWLGNIDKDYVHSVSESEVQRLHDAGLINFLGYKNDVRDVMRRADCIVLPSYHEGMSRVLMEALAMGKPVIVSDVAGCRETVDDGVNGFLCEARDAVSLVMAIEKFMALSEDERVEMGRHSRTKAEMRFDIREVIEIYESLIDTLLPRDRG